MITISFEPLTGSRWNTPTQRMRGLLKVALRGFGFRCVMIKEEAEPCATQAKTGDCDAGSVKTADLVRTRPGAN